MSDNDLPIKPAATSKMEKGRGGAVFAFFAGLALLVFVGFACFYYFVAKPMKNVVEAPARNLVNAMSHILGKEVTMTGSTMVLEKSEIDELAVVQRKTQVITKYETTWLGSDKILIVRCDFLVKAGFDFSEGMEWAVREGQVLGDWPSAKILSVEPLGDFEIYHSESGTLNKLNSEDHAKAFNFLKNQARKDAEKSDIAEEAERVLKRRLNDRLGNPTSTDGVLP